MIRIEAHVPVSDNDKNAFDIDIFNELELLIFTYATGFSKSGEEGAWYTSDGNLCIDVNLKYTIDMSDAVQAVILRNVLAEYIKINMKQEEAYVQLYKLEGISIIDGRIPLDPETELTVFHGFAYV